VTQFATRPSDSGADGLIPAQLVEQLSTALARWERLALDLEEGRLEVVAGPVTKRRFHRGWRHHPSASRARRRRRCRSPGRSGRGDTTPIVIPTHGRVRVPDRRRLQHAGGQATQVGVRMHRHARLQHGRDLEVALVRNPVCRHHLIVGRADAAALRSGPHRRRSCAGTTRIRCPGAGRAAIR